MREEDLIPTFLDALNDLDPARAKAMREDPDNAEIFAWLEDPENVEYPESASYFLNEDLWNSLDEFAPAYCYFGSHPGDGADYGFWPVEDLQQSVKDNDGLCVSDLADVPEDFSGEVLEVNDHGNATLFAADHGKLTELWSAV